MFWEYLKSVSFVVIRTKSKLAIILLKPEGGLQLDNLNEPKSGVCPIRGLQLL